MASLRQLMGCIGRTEDTFSVVQHFFGYRVRTATGDVLPYVPRPLANPTHPNFTKVSVLEQVRLIQGEHFHLNVIRVGDELFTQDHYEKICDGIQIMRFIFGQFGLGVGRVLWWFIPEDEAGDLVSPVGNQQFTELTNGWSAPEDGMDLFCCTVLTDRAGRTGQPWANDWENYNAGHSCNKDTNKHNSGSVARLNDSREEIGNTFAHEIGHYFGLGHAPDDVDTNFMHSSGGVGGSATGTRTFQGDFMKRHCFIEDGC